MTPPSPPTPLGELAALFLRLGATSFGGPAAHIAMLEHEVVERRGWMTREQYLDLLGATQLMPGPNSTEMAIHVGYLRAGLPGLVVAGIAFLAPAVLLTGLLAWGYVRGRGLPQVDGLLYGVKPVILAIVVGAFAGMAPKAAPTRRLQALGLAAAGASLAGAHELAVLLLAGLAAVATAPRAAGLAFELGAGPLAAAGAAVALEPATLFTVFLKCGGLLFGSGYVLLAYLRADLVVRLGWLTEAQLIDAVAAGQLTPGPVFSTATFVGYLLDGTRGAALATLGIFLPSFFLVAATGPLVHRIRESPTAGALLDGVNVASLALMGVVAGRLGIGALVDLPTGFLFGLSALGLIRYKVDPTRMIVAAGAAGLLLKNPSLFM